ncbi:MAG TPA: APC family permease [Candidatus Kapabacteria bacterium]|nr:APC family permease [Candidatus Kapabacteria bacterium]
MKWILIVVLNAGLLALFIKFGKKKNLLSFLDGGKWWLTWLAIAIITLMDELTSIFYVPAESYLLVGVAAFVFIIATSLFIRFLSSRMVEIAHILEHHGIRGGGVYSFSYLVLGPTMSFAAVASILVDYILTAAISTVSAVYNGSSLFSISPVVIYVLFFAAIWAVALLNIVGIRENARFTYFIFVAAAMILLTLVLSAVIDPSPGQIARATEGFHLTWTGITGQSLFGGINFFIFGFAGVILAYSGIESVIQTAGLVKSWKEIRKAYIFLAVTVGIVTPLITMLVLTRTDINFAAHEDDLITYFARVVNGPVFAYLVGGLASFTLIMAVNTAFVASSELLERVAHRYGFAWLIKTNKADSLYRIHIMNATLFSVVIAITAGSQEMLAHMYAVGLVASFTINMGALVYYRYSEGSEEIPDYHTSRTGTFIIFLLLLAVFSFIAYHKWQGFLLWAITVTIFQIIGFRVAKRRAPEIEQFRKTDNPMELLFRVAESDEAKPFHFYFRRPKDQSPLNEDANHAYVTFYSPRSGSPPKLGKNHYLLTIFRESMARRMVSLIYMLQYDFGDRKLVFHLGWPTSSWLDRFSTGVMVFSLMRLPKRFPAYSFVIEYEGSEEKAEEVKLAES